MKVLKEKETRSSTVVERYCPNDPVILDRQVRPFHSDTEGEVSHAIGAIVPHAGLDYSGHCAAQVFARLDLPPVVVLLAPNHPGLSATAGASLWGRGVFTTPIGPVAVAEDFAAALVERSRLVIDQRSAHRFEHTIEFELPFVELLAPDAEIVPLLIDRDDWPSCRELADDLARLISEWPEDVLLLASSDMTHFESPDRVRENDSLALDAMRNMDPAGLLEGCHREPASLHGRAPAAVALETAHQLGATHARLVDYRPCDWNTGEDSCEVAYAGLLIE